MKKLTALIITILISLSVWADDKTALETINSRIVEMQTMADNMINSIEINSQGDELKFEDYQQAKSELNNNIEIALTEYRQGLETIKEDLQTNLATYESELQSYKAAYEARGGKALEKAVDDRMKRFSSLVEALEERLNKSYQSMLIKVMTLNGKFTFPGKRQAGIVNLLYLGSFISPFVFAGGFVLLSTGVAEAAGIVIMLISMPIIGGSIGAAVEGAYDMIGRSYIYDNVGLLETSTNGKWNYERLIKESRNSIFGKCETAGCVYLLAEDLKASWKNLKKLNSTLKLWEGFKLKKIKAVSNHLANKRIDEIAKEAAKTKNK